MRRSSTMVWVALWIFIVILASSTGSEARYTPQVREARAWARAQINDGQWRCLHVLWKKESGWNVHSWYPRGAPLSRAAYGIPQFYPGTKIYRLARHNAKRQVRMGLHYIWSRWGTPCHARRFQRVHRWY